MAPDIHRLDVFFFSWKGGFYLTNCRLVCILHFYYRVWNGLSKLLSKFFFTIYISVLSLNIFIPSTKINLLIILPKVLLYL